MAELTFNQAGLEKKVQVGDAIELDGVCFSEKLTDCTDWNKAQFRVKMSDYEIAINVELTGRKVYRDNKVYKSRARFDFPGNIASENDSATGWVYLHAQTH